MSVFLRNEFSPAGTRLVLLATVVSLLACLSSAAPALAEQTYEGTLQVTQADGLGGESIDPEYILETEGGMLDVVPTELGEDPSSGDTAEVTGEFEEGELVGEVEVTAQAEDEVSGPRKVLVLAVRFPGDPAVPFSLDSIRKKIFTGEKSVNSFYQEESYGQISFAGKLDPEGDIYGWFEIDPVEGCDHGKVRKEARVAAEDEGISLNGYDHIVHVHTTLPCWWGGLAGIGGWGISINGSQSAALYTHEFGHNLGFHHASRLHCKDAEGNSVAVSDDCTSDEYGDPFDVMGAILPFRHNSAYRLEHAGIIGAENVATIEADGTYEVESALEPTEGITALRIPRFFDDNRKLTGYYELEIRKQGGLFENVSSSSMTGVAIRKVSAWRYRHTYLYTALPQGETFTDGSVSITTLSAGEGEATVEVDVPPESDIQPPTAPTGLTATVLSEGLDGVELSWEASEDNVGVARYAVFRNGEEVGSSTETEFTDFPRSNGLHAYVVYAEDEGGNRSEASEEATADVTLPFTIPPTQLSSIGSKGAGDGQFWAPYGVAVDPSGDVWVTESSSLNRVQKFNENGELLLKFGGEGSGNGKFVVPRAIAATAAGDVWVVDQLNHRVQKFNSEGEYLDQFGTQGGGNGQFINPFGIAVAPDGSIWVSDAGRDDIQKFTSSGEFVLKSGGGGSGNGQFANPVGVATDAAGNVWVADRGNDRVQKLSSAGAFLAKFGSEGSGPGQFSEPRGVAVKPDGSLLVTDESRIRQLTPEGQLLSEVNQPNPQQIALGPVGKFYVPEYSASSRVGVWSQPAKPEAITEVATDLEATEATLNATVNPAGEDTAYWFEYGQTTAYGSKAPATPKFTGWGAEPVAVSEALGGLSRETVYHYRVVAENGEGTAYGDDVTFVTPAATPTSLFDFGSEGSGDGQFDTPVGVAADPSGDVWVSDVELNRVQKFTEKGEFLFGFGSYGSGNGEFKAPLGMATTPSGNLLVVDILNRRVQTFDSEGGYLGQFGTEGTGDGQFLHPIGIAVAPDGSIWVSDDSRDDVQKFTSSGEFVLKSGGKGSGNGQFSSPQGLATDAAGNLWVADRLNDRVQKLSASGAFLAKFGSAGSGPGQFDGPADVEVKPNGTLLVSDLGNARVQNLTTSGYVLAEVEQSNPQHIALGLGGKFFVPEASGSRQVRVWSQPAEPDATTEAASGLETTEATLNATVNPSGAETTYRFQWGETTSYGNNVPIPPESIGSGTEPVAVSETIGGLLPETLYHYRVVAESPEGTAYGEDVTFAASDPSGLVTLPVVQPFDGSGPSLEGFADDWSALGWAGGETPKGQDTTSGWRPLASHPTVNGAFYEPTLTDAGSGVAVAATLGSNVSTSSRHFSLWLGHSAEGEARTGYELRFTVASLWVYDVTLSKWVDGSQSVLASESNVIFLSGGSFGLVDDGTTVTAWTKLGSGPFEEVLSASDTAFDEGHAGVEGNDNAFRLKGFKAGSLG